MVTILYFMVKTICVTIILNHLWVFVFGSRMYGLWDGVVRWLRIVRVRSWKLHRKYLKKKKDARRKPETQTTSEDMVPVGKHIHENSAVSETASPVSIINYAFNSISMIVMSPNNVHGMQPI